MQGHVISEDRLGGLAYAAVAAGRAGVGGGRVEFGEEEPGLRAAGVTDDETGQRKAVLDEILF